jgi:hypothetical protein
MLYPSGIQMRDGEQVRVEKVEEGVYAFKNAYDGVYEFFDDTPIRSVSAQSSESREERSEDRML